MNLKEQFIIQEALEVANLLDITLTDALELVEKRPFNERMFKIWLNKNKKK